MIVFAHVESGEGIERSMRLRQPREPHSPVLWNPVKELKDLLDGRQSGCLNYVESGEGIESLLFPITWIRANTYVVESGEGIESSANP